MARGSHDDLLRAAYGGDKYAGCCISLSARAKAAVMHSGSLGSRIAFARVRGRPANLFVICVYVPLEQKFGTDVDKEPSRAEGNVIKILPERSRSAENGSGTTLTPLLNISLL